MDYSKQNWNKRKYGNDTVIYTKSGGTIADVKGTTTDEAKADLVLIANAKNMFECLEGINELMNENQSEYGAKIALMESAKILKKIHSDYGKLLK